MLSRDGTVIEFSQQGHGPVVVLVEPVGHFRQCSAFGGLAALLASHFSVVTYDRRGRGNSTDTAPYSPQREVEDLSAVIAGTGGSAFVYGFSSGALLALHSATAGAPIERLAVLEPPVRDFDAPRPDPLTARLADLIASGCQGDVVTAFHESIGVPPEFIDQMRTTPHWEAMVAIAPTFVYDCRISDATTPEVLAAVTVPTLVMNSEGSTEDLTGSAAQVSALLPNATHRSLPGQWHTVDDQLLATALIDFFDPSPSTHRETELSQED